MNALLEHLLVSVSIWQCYCYENNYNAYKEEKKWKAIYM